MTLHERSVILAEAATADARGMVAVVGLEPQFWLVPIFPGAIAFALVVTLESDQELIEPDLSGTGTLTITVSAPDGKVLFFAEDHRDPRVQRDPNLPPRMQVVANINLQVEGPGTYVAAVSWKLDEGMPKREWSREVRVRPAPSG